MPLALSTAWFARRFESATELIDATSPTGFASFEVASGTLGFWPHGLAQALQRQGRRVVALEDPIAGVPAGESGDGRHLGSLSDNARARSLERALRTAQASRSAGCPRVIVRPGWIVADEPDAQARLAEAIDTQAPAERYLAEAERFRDWVARREIGFLDRFCRSLFDLSKREPEIDWCLCPGAWPGEFGSLAQLENVFETLGRQKLSYWHDTAAIEMRHRLGESSQEAWLDLFGRRLAGVYLNDWRGARAGQPPGTGSIDFQVVRSLLSESTERVLRLDGDVEPENVRLGRLYLDKFRF